MKSTVKTTTTAKTPTTTNKKTVVKKTGEVIKALVPAKLIPESKVPLTSPSKEASKIITDLIAIGKPKAKKTIIITTVAPTAKKTVVKTTLKTVVATAPVISKPAVVKAKPSLNFVVSALEMLVLNSLVSMLYAEPFFSDVVANDLTKALNISLKQLNPVLISLTEKSLIYTDDFMVEGTNKKKEIVYLHNNAFGLHPSKAWQLEKSGENTITQEATSKTTAAKEIAQRKEQVSKPYSKFGLHGHNEELSSFKAGDRVEFEIKKKSVVGSFVHFHINNHSPLGYVVIKFDGKIYERVLAKVKKVVENSQIKAAVKSLKTPEVKNKIAIKPVTAPTTAVNTKKTVVNKRNVVVA